MHMFRLAELLQTLFAKFAAAPTELKTTEGSCIIVRERIVDPEGTRLNLLDEAFGFKGLIGIEVCAKAILRVVRQSQGFIKGTIGHNWNGRAEGFFTHNAHGMLNIRYDSWIVAVATFEMR